MLICLIGLLEKPNRRTSDRVRRSKIDLDASQLTDVNNYRYACAFSFQPLINCMFAFDCLYFSYRIFVATWNVAGKSPPSYLNLEEWLHTSPPADVYVLG